MQGQQEQDTHWEEDCVQYQIYPSLSSYLKKESPKDVEYELLACVFSYLEYLSVYIRDYIWQKDCFYLKVNNNYEMPHLYGKARFGDNIEDEWFIVFLLFELSKKFPEIVISTTDNDGQFLLIESALHIPRWLNPENSENKVWIHKGKLHILPPPSTPAQLIAMADTKTSVAHALQLVRDTSVNTEASAEVQEILQQRIQSCYPQNVHCVRCIVPVSVAHVLYYNPQLVAPAVEAFYHRDLEGMKYCTKMAKFSPEKRVATMVKFTRCLYAQILKQNFRPPRMFGEPPPPSHPDAKAFDIGAKLACGFEIMYHTSKGKSIPENGVDVQNYDFASDNTWNTFQKSLQLENLSPKFEERAKLFYLKYKSGKYISNPNAVSKASIVDQTYKQYPQFDTASLPPLVPDDDEKWLDIAPEDLDSLLESRFQGPTKQNKPEEFTNFDGLVDRMKAFVSNKSDYEGVDTTDQSSKGFDEEKFFQVMRNTLGIQEEDDEKDFSDEEFDDEMYENLETQDPILSQLMEQMDTELSQTLHLGNDFERVPTSESSQAERQPVDVNLNLVKNLLESYSQQYGMAGPLTNILGDMRDTSK